MKRDQTTLKAGLVAACLCIAALAACSPQTEARLTEALPPTALPTPIPPTAVVEQPPMLVVCLFQEPNTLYRYGSPNHAAEAVLEAIYDGPEDLLSYRYSPVILEKTPSLEDGDARVEPVEVGTGDVYLNPNTLQPDTFGIGASYLPAGCHDLSCMRTYQGGGATLDRMAVEFRLLADLTWSDGEPLQASDSVFSFNIDAHADTPTVKYLVNRTFRYEATDERGVRWTGIPGFLDAEYASNFWTPLPEHVLGGLSPGDLPQAELASRRPLGWGPYKIDSWEPGEALLLSANRNYFRAGEGLPAFEELVFRFLDVQVEGAVDQVLSGECDVLDELSLDEAARNTLTSLKDDGRAALSAAPGSTLERLEFDLAPVSGTLAFFRSPNVRRALAECINREGLLDDLFLGYGELSDTYLAPSHPQYAISAESILFDPAHAAQLLDQSGWRDEDGDPATPRVARGVAGAPDGTPLSIRYAYAPGAYHDALAERMVSELGRCGVDLQLERLEADRFFAAWPQGPVFGRTFELAGWAWPLFASPPCEMYLSGEIPSDDAPFGANASGFSDPDYDQACTRLLLAPPDSAEGREAAARTQAIFASSLPAVPLFAPPRVVVHAPDLCGVEVDPSALTVFWNLEAFTRSEACAGP